MLDVTARRYVYVLPSVWALCGCSLAYNPDNLPAPALDAAPMPVVDGPSREIDAAPDTGTIDDHALAITAVGPHVLFEGQGAGGSRSGILVIAGRNIAPDAVVTLVPTAPAGSAPLITLDGANAVHTTDGTLVAVPVSLPIDVGRGAGDVALTVQITQAGGAVIMPLDGQVVLRTLPELDAAPTGALAALYSRVKLSSALTLAASAGAAPVVIRAVSSIDLRDVHLDAAASVPGVGGNAGGAAGQVGSGPGGGLGGGLLSGGVVMAGSGGGFGTAGGVGKSSLGGTNAGGAIAGDDLLFLTTNRSSGGGGGSSVPGGGGGGTLELTCGGTLKADTISANGGAGGNDSLLNGAGGGGSGGAILLRAGAAATIGKVTVTGGPGGDHSHTGGAVAGTGGEGRVRFDLAATVGTPMLPASSRAGVAFSSKAGDNPLITRDAAQGITVTTKISATSSNAFDLFVFDAEQTTVDSQNVSLVSATTVLKPRIAPGYNRVCVTPHQRNPLVDVSVTNCVDVAYAP